VRRRLILCASVIAALSLAYDVGRLAGIIQSSAVFQKDFMAYYLPGRALLAGGNVYDSLPVLANKYEPRVGHHFEHPSPYPPIALLLLSPLALLPYEHAVSVWSIFEFSCFAITCLLLLRHFGGRNAPTSVIVTILLVIPWRPIFTDLYVGQMMMFLGLLLVLAWLSLRSGRDVLAGFLLGLVLALKLYGWPIIIFLLLSKRFTPVITAILVFIFANLLGAAVVGPQTAIEYYSVVAPGVRALYIDDPFNFSLSSTGFRLAGPWLGVILTIGGLATSLGLALRNNADRGFVIMLSASIVLAPIAWLHYLVTLVPALCFIVARKDIQKSELIAAALIIVAIIFGFETYAHKYSAFATWPPLVLVICSIWMLRATSPARETEALKIEQPWANAV
jgi:alpha-1,2-mannosyltransferase